MKLTNRRFSTEDFKEQQNWITKLLSPLNQFIEEVFRAFNNQLTIEDNLYQEIKEIKIQNVGSNFPINIKTKFNVYPKGLHIIYCSASDGSVLTAAPWTNWSFNNQQLIISNITGLTSGLTYTIRILIIYN